MVLRFLLGQLAAGDILGHDRVVLGQPAQITLAEQVTAAVADMGEARRAVLVESGEGHGGGHTGEPWAVCHLRQDRPVGGEHGFGRRQAEIGGNLDRQFARNLAADVPAETVGDHEEDGVTGAGTGGIHRILVDGTRPPRVGRRRPQIPHFTSKTVFPI